MNLNIDPYSFFSFSFSFLDTFFTFFFLSFSCLSNFSTPNLHGFNPRPTANCQGWNLGSKVRSQSEVLKHLSSYITTGFWVAPKPHAYYAYSTLYNTTQSTCIHDVYPISQAKILLRRKRTTHRLNLTSLIILHRYGVKQFCGNKKT